MKESVSISTSFLIGLLIGAVLSFGVCMLSKFQNESIKQRIELEQFAK